MMGRKVKCLTCNHEWVSKADKPRCSRCDSRNVEDVRIEPAVEDIRDGMIQPHPLGALNFSKIYIGLEEGKTPIDLVKLGLCNPDEALETWNEYEELKRKTLEIEGRPILEARVDELENQISDLDADMQHLSKISSAREEKNSNTIETLKNQISNLQTDLQRLSKTSNDCEKSNTVDHDSIFYIIGTLEKRIYGFHSNKCPKCGQQAVVVFARCRNCGVNLERYP
jgi:chaperonin cofactor prefoldin